MNNVVCLFYPFAANSKIKSDEPGLALLSRSARTVWRDASSAQDLSFRIF